MWQNQTPYSWLKSQQIRNRSKLPPSKILQWTFYSMVKDYMLFPPPGRKQDKDVNFSFLMLSIVPEVLASARRWEKVNKNLKGKSNTVFICN